MQARALKSVIKLDKNFHIYYLGTEKKNLTLKCRVKEFFKRVTFDGCICVPCVKPGNLNDIVVEDINAVDLYQTKLHFNSVADLTNRSADFWKTIRVWSEAIIANLIDLNSTIFTLITPLINHPHDLLANGYYIHYATFCVVSWILKTFSLFFISVKPLNI